MTPQDEARIRELIRQELSSFIMSDRFLFSRHLQIMDGRNIQVGNGVGTTFGTETTQKIGFLGKTPIVRQATITAPIGGGSGATDAIDIQARAAINEIKALLTAFGFTA